MKYMGWLEFDSPGSCGAATGWLFSERAKQLMKLLIAPFDINSGFSL